jgi:hypothetical protein
MPQNTGAYRAAADKISKSKKNKATKDPADSNTKLRRFHNDAHLGHSLYGEVCGRVGG